MAQLRIFTYPEIVLTRRARPVERVERHIRHLADDMLETMYFAPGVGLAANQVGILERVLVLDVDFSILDDEALAEYGLSPPESESLADSALNPNEGPTPVANPSKEVRWVGGRALVHRKPRVIINPQIIYREGNALLSEGCLSVPDISAKVYRAERLKLRYQDIDGRERVLLAEGLLAHAIQHEIDHLDGRLFIERLDPKAHRQAKKKLQMNLAQEADPQSSESPPSKRS